MRQAVRAVVVRNGYLLVMHRNKFGQEYYTLPGGGMKPNEQAEHALFRQMQEETGVQIINPRLVIVEEAGDPFGTHYIYLCQYVSGEPELSPASEEAQINKLGQNLYSPQWLPLHSLASVPFRSETLKHTLLQGLAKGFDQRAILISSKQEQ